MPDPVTGITAGASLLGGYMSSRSADKASKRAARASARELEFQQKRYDDWLEVFGPIQDNLADYYNSLTPDYYETVGIEAFETERAIAEQQLTETLAQRGITDSGLAAGLEQDLALEAAQTRAQIRRDAPRKAAEDKMRFLQVGMGMNPSESMANTLANRSAQAASTARNVGTAAAENIGTSIQTAGTALADYFREDSNA